MGGRGGAKSDRSGGTCPQEWAGDLLGLRSSEAGLRSAAGTAIRVRTVVGDGRVLRVKHSRWCLLKRPENRTEKETVKLSELMQYNLQSVRGHLLREDFQRFWEYTSPTWAGKFLDQWCTRTMRSKIEPMKKIVKTLREHRDLILNWF